MVTETIHCLLAFVVATNCLRETFSFKILSMLFDHADTTIDLNSVVRHQSVTYVRCYERTQKRPRGVTAAT